VNNAEEVTPTKLFLILCIIGVLKVLNFLSRVGHPSKLIMFDTFAYLSNLFDTYQGECLRTISIT